MAASTSYVDPQALVTLLERLPRLLFLGMECGDLGQTFAKRVGDILRQTKAVKGLSIGLRRKPRHGNNASTGAGMVEEDELAQSEIPGLLASGLDLDTLILSGIPYRWRSGAPPGVPITCRELVLEQSRSSRASTATASRTYIQGLALSLQPPPTDIVYSFDHEDCIDLLSVVVAWGTHMEDLVVEAPFVPNEQLPAVLNPLYELFERCTRLRQLSLPAGCYCTALVGALPSTLRSLVADWRYPSYGLQLKPKLYAGPFFALRMGLKLTPAPQLRHITIIQPAEEALGRMFKEDPAWGELAEEQFDEWIRQAEMLEEACIGSRIAMHPKAFGAGVQALAARYEEMLAEESKERQQGMETIGSVSSV